MAGRRGWNPSHSQEVSPQKMTATQRRKSGGKRPVSDEEYEDERNMRTREEGDKERGRGGRGGRGGDAEEKKEEKKKA